MDRDGANTGRLRCRGVRGATVALADTRDAIHSASRELVNAMVEANGIRPDDLAAAFFTTTPDLRAAFPAEAIRLTNVEWEYVPMMGAVEMDKEGAVPCCIRVLLLWNTIKGQGEIEHIYLRGTESLRTTGDLNPAQPTKQHSSTADRKDH